MVHPFEFIEVPALPPRPRTVGVTAILDKGLSPRGAADLVTAAGDWIDVVRLGWGSARVTDGDALRDKIATYQAAGVRVCSGGTILEIALAQDKVDSFLAAAADLKLDMVEVSNGVHPMSAEQKHELIRRAVGAGFRVWSEVGKKDPAEDARLSTADRVAAVEADLAAGADKVVLEARESGTVGIYDGSGRPATELVDRLAQAVGIERLVFEAPKKSQQVWMIRHFGPLVNLGNVAVDEAIPLATLRTGLRGDTFADFHLRGVEVFVTRGANGAMEARRRGGIAIVVDALRFSATVVTALAAGMRQVRVVSTAGECVGEVTAGERGGTKLAHVDHGNSPLELLRHDHRGKELVITSTNGAEMVLTCAGEGTQVLIGTTVNATAVAEAAVRLATERGEPITLVEAGRNNLRAPEDSLAAGTIFHAMRGAYLHGPALPTSEGLESDFYESASGQNLRRLGYADDVRFCAQVDRYDVVPCFVDGALVDLRTVARSTA